MGHSAGNMLRRGDKTQKYGGVWVWAKSRRDLEDDLGANGRVCKYRARPGRGRTGLARFIRIWLKLPHIPHTSLSSNPSHEEDSSIRFSFSMKTEAWRVILVPQNFLIPALMKSHVGSKGGWRGVMNLKPKLLVHELLASGYKKSICHEDGDLMYEERRGV
ncbi:hypothetical protein F2Q69_00016862 [Brassica cretica]|uniref:Uncharacterized protein n=1 Tax=Brassica cretica TaxID=69181 RepID=A0A8S9QXW9_BRACR|nr:hypothetical protein F2Q69_00016862 [Brassica cretica]